jgi:hypothetical protein
MPRLPLAVAVASRAALLVFVAACAAACSPTLDRQPAQDAVRAFHAQLDAHQYEAIVAAAGGEIGHVRSQAEFLQLLESVHDRLGNTKSSKETSWTAKFGNDDAVLTLDYATAYANGDATEHFSYRMKGNDVRLVGYRIESKALNGS